MVRTPLGVPLPAYLKLRLLGDRPASFRVRNASITLGISSVLELWRGTTYETKEPETLDWIDTFASTDVFFDVGANIGLYSLYAAATRKCRVFSFEPEGKNFSRLVQNQFLNDLGAMRAFCLAVGKSTRIDELFITGTTAGDSQHNIGGENRLYARAHSGIQGSIVVALDALCYSHGLPVPQHLKIDVDGLEEEIIEGAPRLLRDPALRTVMVEISDHRDKASPIYEAMSAAGFEITGRAKRAYENDLIVARNTWFSRPAEDARALSAV